MNTYTLIVSEPWDFKSQRGDNHLNGKIVRQVDSENLLFVADEPFASGGITSLYWILSSRYEKQQFAERPYRGTINGGLIASLPSEFETAVDIKKQAVFAVIGSIQPV